MLNQFPATNPLDLGPFSTSTPPTTSRQPPSPSTPHRPFSLQQPQQQPQSMNTSSPPNSPRASQSILSTTTPTTLSPSQSSSSPNATGEPIAGDHETIIAKYKTGKLTQYQDDQLVEKALLEDSFIEHGILAVDKSVSILGEILNLSEGRDKLFKLLSASLKLTRYGINTFCTPTPQTRDLLDRIKTCSTATSNTRLFLKLCTDWVFFRLVIRIWYQQRWGWLKLFTIIRLTGMGLYFTFQLPIWLSITGLVRNVDRGFWQKMSLRSYIISVCSQIFMDFRKVVDLTKEIGYWQLIVPTDLFKQVLPQSLQYIHQHVNNSLNGASYASQPKTLEQSTITQKTANSKKDEKKQSPPVVSKQQLISQQEEDMSYALSFQQRCTPTTTRYQALLNRTIWLQQTKQQIADNNIENNSLGSQFVHPLNKPFNSMTSSADEQFNEQLRQLREETKLALIHENMLQKDRNKLFVNFVKDGGDLFGALDGLLEWGHSDLTLGLVSFTSASISLYRMWDRYKKAVEKKFFEEENEKIKKKQIEDERLKQEEEFAALFNQLRQQLTNSPNQSNSNDDIDERC